MDRRIKKLKSVACSSSPDALTSLDHIRRSSISSMQMYEQAFVPALTYHLKQHSIPIREAYTTGHSYPITALFSCFSGLMNILKVHDMDHIFSNAPILDLWPEIRLWCAFFVGEYHEAQNVHEGNVQPSDAYVVTTGVLAYISGLSGGAKVVGPDFNKLVIDLWLKPVAHDEQEHVHFTRFFANISRTELIYGKPHWAGYLSRMLSGKLEEYAHIAVRDIQDSLRSYKTVELNVLSQQVYLLGIIGMTNSPLHPFLLQKGSIQVTCQLLHRIGKTMPQWPRDFQTIWIQIARSSIFYLQSILAFDGEASITVALQGRLLISLARLIPYFSLQPEQASLPQTLVGGFQQVMETIKLYMIYDSILRLAGKSLRRCDELGINPLKNDVWNKFRTYVDGLLVMRRVCKGHILRCVNPPCGRAMKHALVCTNCTVHGVTYCSAECQKEHWPDHKPECKISDNGLKDYSLNIPINMDSSYIRWRARVDLSQRYAEVETGQIAFRKAYSIEDQPHPCIMLEYSQFPPRITVGTPHELGFTRMTSELARLADESDPGEVYFVVVHTPHGSECSYRRPMMVDAFNPKVVNKMNLCPCKLNGRK